MTRGSLMRLNEQELLVWGTEPRSVIIGVAVGGFHGYSSLELLNGHNPVLNSGTQLAKAPRDDVQRFVDIRVERWPGDRAKTQEVGTIRSQLVEGAGAAGLLGLRWRECGRGSAIRGEHQPDRKSVV